MTATRHSRVKALEMRVAGAEQALAMLEALATRTRLELDAVLRLIQIKRAPRRRRKARG